MKPGAVDHPKTLELARRLKATEAARSWPAQAIGHLAALWAWAWRVTDDGDLSAFEATDIAAAAKWRGDPEAFLDILVESEALDRDGESLRLHDADQHTPRYVTDRLRNRGKPRSSRTDPRTDPRIRPQTDPTASASASASVPVPSERRSTDVASRQSATLEKSRTKSEQASRCEPWDRTPELDREQNPHEPQEQTASVVRSPTDPESICLNKALAGYLASWEARHGRRPDFPRAQLDRLRGEIHRHYRQRGPSVLLDFTAGFDAFLAHEHQSVTGHTPSQFCARVEEWLAKGKAPTDPNAPDPELVKMFRDDDEARATAGGGR